MSSNVKTTQHLSISTSFERHDNGNVKTKIDFLPSVGNHYLKYKGTWIKVERTREKSAIDIQNGSLWETVTLTMLGRDKQILINLLNDAKQLALKEEYGTTIIYTCYGHEWRPFGNPRRRRPITSVFLDGATTDEIVNDVKDFVENPGWYIDRGIPYRRGYLLYGPPGSGKSSFIQALAGQLEYNICILSLSDASLTDDRLIHLLSVAPERSIILLEDIDAAFTNRNDTKEKTTQYQGLNRLTFSGLLNALDGVAASEGRLLFMTTNHLEKLDPALIRPGRVDVKHFLGNASRTQIEKMFIKFFPELSGEDIVTQFSETIGDNVVSMAELQGYLLLFKNAPKLALVHLDDWLNALLSK
eukprot:TRINITY_DN1440_c0_g1_i2.p1 TRINITY_DN1440_c0_g1~~TRINITY_DN1440_c0_g1_i2.p1  ORF type:complete len:358 (-),score=85.51 TRINITY_DN1440_c0_g1_i2:59-1132(-)